MDYKERRSVSHAVSQLRTTIVIQSDNCKAHYTGTRKLRKFLRYDRLENFSSTTTTYAWMSHIGLRDKSLFLSDVCFNKTSYHHSTNDHLCWSTAQFVLNSSFPDNVATVVSNYHKVLCVSLLTS